MILSAAQTDVAGPDGEPVAGEVFSRPLGPAGREGDLLRRVLPWSLGLLLVMCLIVVGQSTPVLDRTLP